MSGYPHDVVAEPFLAACICPRFAAWLERFPEAAYELAKIVPAESTAVTLRRADLTSVINAPRARAQAHEERRHG